MTNIIEIKNLTKKYGGVVALDGVNLNVTGGKIIGLLGPNGSGKTTFFKCLSGLLTYDGEIFIGGHKVGVETKKLVSFLPERTYLDSSMKVEEAINFFAEFYEDFDIERAYYLLSILGVSKTAKMKTLSKGTKEKVQLILVMSRRALVYLLDEPIGGVDPVAREFIIKTILTRVNEGATIIISTHLIRDVEEILDEYIFINGSKIVAYGDARLLREQGKTVDELFREAFRCF